MPPIGSFSRGFPLGAKRKIYRIQVCDLGTAVIGVRLDGETSVCQVSKKPKRNSRENRDL